MGSYDWRCPEGRNSPQLVHRAIVRLLSERCERLELETVRSPLALSIHRHERERQGQDAWRYSELPARAYVEAAWNFIERRALGMFGMNEVLADQR